jgi:hypothetical protein
MVAARRPRFSAVMARRREPSEALDFLATPPWETPALSRIAALAKHSPRPPFDEVGTLNEVDADSVTKIPGRSP